MGLSVLGGKLCYYSRRVRMDVNWIVGSLTHLANFGLGAGALVLFPRC